MLSVGVDADDLRDRHDAAQSALDLALAAEVRRCAETLAERRSQHQRPASSAWLFQIEQEMLLRGPARQRLQAQNGRSRREGRGQERREASADLVDGRRDEGSTALVEATFARLELPLDRGLDAGSNSAVTHYRGHQQAEDQPSRRS